jgi:hypothetical protein
MQLDRGWRIILRFAVTGFVATLVGALNFNLGGPGAVTGLLMFFSPGMWFLPVVPRGEALAVCLSLTFFPIVSGLSYALVGALIAGLTTKPGQ